MLAYQYDDQGIYTTPVEFDSSGPVPHNALLVPPPKLTGTEVARRAGVKSWEVLPERPARPEPSLEDLVAATVAEYEILVQKRLDDFARTKTYDGILSACTYATSTVPVFHVEGQYCVEARDATWITAQAFLNEAIAAVMAGQRDIPAWEEVEAALPPLAWPEGSRQ